MRRGCCRCQVRGPRAGPRPGRGPPRAAGPSRARRLVHQRRTGHGQARGHESAYPRLGAGRGVPVRSPAPRHLGRAGRPRVHQLPPRRRMVARGPGRPPGRGGGRLRPTGHRPRRDGPGRVHLGQSDRPDPRRKRMVGELRRCPGPRARPHRAPGQPRVLRQRHRRADPGVGGEPARPPPRGGGARGRVPGRVPRRARPLLRGARRGDRGRPLGRRADPRPHPLDARIDRHRLRRVVLPGVDRRERCGGRDHRPARRQGPRLRAGRRDLVPRHLLRRRPRPGVAQVKRGRHLPRR